jgi:hypothetical protein
MGLLRRPTTSKIMEDGRLGRPCGPGVHSRASQKPRLRLRRQSHISTAVPAHPSMVGAGPVGSSPPANVPPRPQARPPTVRPDASCMASTPGWCRLTSSGPVVVSPAILSADTAPNHPMRVRTAHPGWAHAGRQRAGWAKGARLWRTPSGPRTPPRPTAPAICWSSTSTRSPTAWRARWHNGCCGPVEGRRRPLPACFRFGHCVDRRPTNNGGRHEHHRRDRQRDSTVPRRYSR